MNKFELFSMIYYALNHYWKENKSEELTSFLSDMNPFYLMILTLRTLLCMQSIVC